MDERHPRVTIIGLNYAPEPTGIAPYTSGLASGLASRGWAVRAITAFPHYPAWKIAAGYEGHTMKRFIDGVRVTRLRPYMPKKLSGFKRALLEVSFGVRAISSRWGKADVVVLVSPALFATAIALLRARLTPGRPLVFIWVQDLYSLGVKETGTLGTHGARVMSKIEKSILRQADSVVVIHDRFRDYLTSEFRIPFHRVRVVRNWTHLLPIEVERNEFRTLFGWGDEVVVLHAGNIGAKQGLENVVEAARIADARGEAVRFVLLGDGNQRARLEKLAEGVARLDFLDSLNNRNFQGAMAAADILLVNEKKGVAEMAVPSKLTSYFAAGRPVIVATDENSISAEEVAQAGAGWRVDADSPAALLEASLALGVNTALAEEMARSGAKFQRETLSRSNAINHYAEIIQSQASERGRRLRKIRD
jgi:colanic acid biosynthesis glycosyl transferase WcaI